MLAGDGWETAASATVAASPPVNDWAVDMSSATVTSAT